MDPISASALNIVKKKLIDGLKKYTFKFLDENGYGAERITKYICKDIKKFEDALTEDEITYLMITKKVNIVKSTDDTLIERSIVIPVYSDLINPLQDGKKYLMELESRLKQLVEKGRSRISGERDKHVSLKEKSREFYNRTEQQSNRMGMRAFGRDYTFHANISQMYVQELLHLERIWKDTDSHIVGLKKRLDALSGKYRELKVNLIEARAETMDSTLRIGIKHGNLLPSGK